MFEAVEKLSVGARLCRAVREAVSLQRCVALTRAQRLARALFWLALGFAIARFGTAYLELRYPTPVMLLPPAIDQQPGYTRFTFRFDQRGSELACHLIVYHNEHHTWSVSC